MPLLFLLDEHLRGPLWNAIQRHNTTSAYPIDAIRIGDSEDLPLGIADPDILLWAEREDRIVVTEDKHTMPGNLRDRLESGNHTPGLFVVRVGHSWAQLVECLELVAHAGDPTDYRDVVTFVP